MQASVGVQEKVPSTEETRWGIRALELTNQFRAKNNLHPLRWNQNLCDIGMDHSRDMANGTVPISHQGFD